MYSPPSCVGCKTASCAMDNTNGNIMQKTAPKLKKPSDCAAAAISAGYTKIPAPIIVFKFTARSAYENPEELDIKISIHIRLILLKIPAKYSEYLI